jgi:hypothetical protein
VAPPPAAVDALELLVLGAPPPRTAFVAGEGDEADLGGLDAADVAGADGDALLGAVLVLGGVAAVEAVTGAGSVVVTVEVVAGGASLAGAGGCSTVDGAGTMIVVGRRRAMNARMPPPMTRTVTRTAAVAR